MDESFRDRLAREVPDWVSEGLITDSQAQRILEYESASGPGGSPAGADWTTTLLYGTAAVLLGAAAIAFVLVGIEPVQEAPYLLAFGAVLAGAGLVLHLVDGQRDLLVDVLLAAAMAPLAAATFHEPEALPGLYALSGLGLPAAYLLLRREQPFLPTLSVIAFSAAAGGTSWTILEGAGMTDDQVAFAWMAFQLLLCGGVVGIDRLLRDRDATVPVALAVIGLAVASIPFLLETLGLQDSETVELALGGIALAILAAGVLIRHRGLVTGASTALGIDAIVFAFDVGGVWAGSVLLVALAALLILQAERIKRWIETAT